LTDKIVNKDSYLNLLDRFGDFCVRGQFLLQIYFQSAHPAACFDLLADEHDILQLSEDFAIYRLEIMKLDPVRMSDIFPMRTSSADERTRLSVGSIVYVQVNDSFQHIFLLVHAISYGELFACFFRWDLARIRLCEWMLSALSSKNIPCLKC
jgi:hypothetical protein